GLDEEQKIWAWFENGLGYNGNKSKSAQIDATINRWFGGSPTDPEDSGWTTSNGVPRLHLIRVLKQYPNGVKPADLSRIETQFRDMIFSGNGSDIWNCGSSNGVVARKAAAYIYLEDHKDATVVWPSLPSYCQGNFNGATNFAYAGNNYQDQQRYNALAIVRDWLYSTFDRWVAAGDWTGEFDAFYTPPLIYALYTLYDFAQDATMRRKAKMMLDMLLLDSIINVSSNNNGEAMHGGIPGRTYGNQILGKTEPWIFWYPAWGLTHGGYKHPWHAFASFYVSEYAKAFSSERIVEDTGYLSDEPDDYSHMATEYHSGGGNRGKWTYITKNYSLGSVLTASNNRWIINVLSRNDRSGSGMRIWIDRDPQIPGPSGGEYYLEYGEFGCQYQNALWAFGEQGSKYLHFADYGRDDKAGNSFDVDENVGGWRFLRKDDAGASVAMAVKMGTYAHAIEMCLIGLDYSSYDDFKNAVQRNASIQDREDGTFTTSKSRKIGREYDQAAQRHYTLVDGKRVFPDGTPDNGQYAVRLKCVDHRGSKIVDWNNNIMTIFKNGQVATYDFNNWLLGGETALPPRPQVDTPTISPYGGTFTGAATVELRTSTSAAQLYYTTDGKTPSQESTLYTGPFQLAASATLKVRGIKSGITASDVVEAFFEIVAAEKVATPASSPNSGTSAEPVVVTLTTATAGAEIYYTLDGATPSPDSTRYTAPFKVSNT
ncbi:MAG: chitobiase/beta-hexosaminidase C-terminal domain-containing protein, partial [bacterium]